MCSRSARAPPTAGRSASRRWRCDRPATCRFSPGRPNPACQSRPQPSCPIPFRPGRPCPAPGRLSRWSGRSRTHLRRQPRRPFLCHLRQFRWRSPIRCRHPCPCPLKSRCPRHHRCLPQRPCQCPHLPQFPCPFRCPRLLPSPHRRRWLRHPLPPQCPHRLHQPLRLLLSRRQRRLPPRLCPQHHRHLPPRPNRRVPSSACKARWSMCLCLPIRRPHPAPHLSWSCPVRVPQALARVQARAQDRVTPHLAGARQARPPQARRGPPCRPRR